MIAGVGEHPIGEKPAAVLEAVSLRAVFVRRGDRFAHRIEVRDAATQQWTTALESREGTDEEPWPPSPPFQQLHVEHRKEGDVVLLVGMAGRSHWSAAVDVGPDRKSLRFDVAVRVQTPHDRLGSGYEIVADGAAAGILPSATVGTVDASRFTFGPDRTDVKLPATICWQYSLGPQPAK